LFSLGPQDPTSFALADQRTFLGLPNALNVLSNLPFLGVGLWGLREAPRVERPARSAYQAFFAAATLVTLGSSYFHLAPSTWSLVWDRLPLAAAFMALLTAMIAERYSAQLAGRLLTPLVILGPLTVVYWYWTTLQGHGDLLPYGLVQYGSLTAIVGLLARYPHKAPGTRYLVLGLLSYVVAKGFELADHQIFALGNIVSGHTVKHLAAAAADPLPSNWRLEQPGADSPSTQQRWLARAR
jgi:hypothetical protein